MADAPDSNDPQLGPAGLALVAVLLLGMVGVIVAAFVMTASAGGATLASLRVSDSPAEATFTVDRDGVVSVWADIDVEHAGISPRSANDSLPHVVDWVVTLTPAAGEPTARRCNPFDSNFARTSSTTNTMGKPASRSYDGLVRSCAFRVAPGEHTVRVRASPVEPDERIRFRRAVLRLRGPS